MQPVRQKTNRPNLFPMGQHQTVVAPRGRLLEGDAQICFCTRLLLRALLRVLSKRHEETRVTA